MEYKEILLHDLVEVYVDNRGKSCPVVDKEGSYLPLIATNCITDDLYPQFSKIRYVDKSTYENWFRAHPQPNDIIFVNKGTPGGTALVPKKVNFCFAQDMVGLRIKKEYNTEYVFAALRSSLVRRRIEAMQVGTMIPHFKKGDFKNLYLPIPCDLKIQKRIGEFHLDIIKKIDINKSIISNLEQLIQTLFKRLFVDFEFPNENGEPYKSSGGEMVNGELGMIPRGWSLTSYYEMAEYVNGAAFKSNELNSSGLPIIKIAELKAGITEQTKFYSKQDKDEKYLIDDRDILFSWSGNPETSIDTFIWFRGKAILNQHIFKVIPIKTISPAYIYAFLKYNKPLFTNIASDKQTTGLGHITKTDLKRLRFVIPDENVMKDFEVLINPIFDSMYLYLKESKLLSETRDTLLPKLLSGELKLPDETEVTEHVPIP